MQFDLGRARPTASFPEDVKLVAFDPSRYALEARSLLNLCYADGGGDVETFEDWWPRISSDDEFLPELCFSVVDRASDQLVAFAQCWSSGFIKDIGVHPDWRRRGVAKALMCTIFDRFMQCGCENVQLKVQSENPHGAVEFYRALGMEALP